MRRQQNKIMVDFRTIGLGLLVLLIPVLTAVRAENRSASTKDSLMRKDLDPFDQLGGAPTRPIDQAREALRFGNSLWGEKFLKYLNQSMNYLPDWRDHIVLPEPPANTSPRTRMELDYLLMLQNKRTEKHKGAIEKEAVLALWDMKTWYGEAGQNKEATRHVLVNVLNDAVVIVINLKKKFSRPRPSVLEPRLAPPIEIPGHPAYPSGHSTETHVFAFVMQEIRPEDAERFHQEAFRISWDREVAGLHYPSDTSSGKLLARQIVDLLLTKDAFLADLEKARKEWTDTGTRP